MLMQAYHRTRRGLASARRLLVPFGRRFLRFLALPRCFGWRVNWRNCPAPKLQVARDMLYIFFRLKTYPENYFRCRMWTVDRRRWPLYYGTLTDPYQRRQLERVVQRPEYAVVFADKELCHHLCRSVGLPVPRFLGCVDPGDDVARILGERLGGTARGALIAKPVRGTGGRDVQAVLAGDGEPAAVAGGRRTPLAQMVIKERMILEELVVQHPDMAAIFPHSVNTVRIETLLTGDGEVLVLGCLVRFGRRLNLVDNIGAGGLGLGVRRQDGGLFPEAWDKAGNGYDRHPDTGVVFQGRKIPHWDQVLALVRRGQQAFPFYRLVGFDVALTADGPVVIEINPQPNNGTLEACSGPLLAEPSALREFQRYGLLVNAPSRALAAALEPAPLAAASPDLEGGQPPPRATIG